MSAKVRIPSETAYSKRPGTYRKELTEVGRGTPMGELMRRYWQVVALSRDATSTPRQVRLLGEDLVLFRDGQGRAGLMYPRCAHRGTTLYYGKVEERGIRCCYHGWLYDVEGHCLEQPTEPNLGAKTRDKVRQPWYPVEERYGLIFAYLGPPDKFPVLPRYECLEKLEEGELIEVDDTSVGTQGAAIMPCNWLQHFENVFDPAHVPILHGTHSGPQFGSLDHVEFTPPDFRETPRGVEFRYKLPVPDGGTRYGVIELMMPCIRAAPNPFYSSPDAPVEALGFMMLIDDEHFRIYNVGRTREKGRVFALPEQLRKMFSEQNYPSWSHMSEEERRARPGDWEAQTGQGAITLHSEEHLLPTSDKGVLLVRKMLLDQLKRIEKGQDPLNVSFDPEAPPIKTTAGGNWTEPPAMV